MSYSSESSRTFRTRIPNGILAISMVVMVELMLFAGLISAHIVNILRASVWPPLGQVRLPIEVTALNTLILLASGFTLYRAVSMKNPVKMRRYTFLTLLLGILFLGIQGNEWSKLLNQGLRLSAQSTVSLVDIPKNVESAIDIAPNLSYSPNTKVLRYFPRFQKSLNSVPYTLSEEKQQRTKILVQYWLSLSQDLKYQKALQELFFLLEDKTNTNNKNTLFESNRSVQLDYLPSEVILNQLKPKILYRERKLSLQGVLSRIEEEKLKAISQDPTYLRKIDILFSQTQSNYGAFFYTVIGAHALHVLAGVIGIFFVVFMVLRRPSLIDGQRAEKTFLAMRVLRIYWFFVVGLWPILYVLVYLI